MVNYIIAFVTGLTTGGLSCLAVQGGLLASSLAGQIEKDIQTAGTKNSKQRRGSRSYAKPETKLAQPILAFLSAKIIAYTILGFILGLLGQMFQLSLFARAFLQIAIGIFMLGSAMRMLNVHPIFRYFAFEPPAFLRRRMRKAAAPESQGSTLTAPIFLGFMTVLIPCGITQAMMALALGTADPLQGAALMFAFTLGTSPVFFAVAYFATQLGKRLEKHFMRFVAVVVLILAIVTIDSGITLAGSPISLTRIVSGAFRPTSEASAAPVPMGTQADQQNAAASNAQPAGENEVTINVENYGYSPDVVHAKAGVPITLRLVTNNVRSCSRAFIIPALNVQKLLDATGEVMIELPAQDKGTEIPFSCSMGMYGGTLVFDL